MRSKRQFQRTNSPTKTLTASDQVPQQAGLKQLSISQQILQKGPLPPPAQLAEYNKINPSFAERIMQMAENQAEHRMKLENKATPNTNSLASLGVWVSAGLTVCGMVAGAMIALISPGLLAIVPPVVGILPGIITSIAAIIRKN